MRTYILVLACAGSALVTQLHFHVGPSGTRAAENVNAKKWLNPIELPTQIRNLPPVKPKVELQLSLFHKMRVGRNEARIELVNVGTVPVTLVKPGDGSNGGSRTPIVRWSILPEGSDEDHPSPRPPGVFRCNIHNPLKADDVFTLKPSEWKQLPVSWTGFSTSNLKPGKYRVVFYYQNDPELKWSADGNHHQKAMQRIRESTPVTLTSNEQIIELIE